MTSVPDRLRPQIDAFIASHGQQVMGVGGGPDGGTFYYTIGNATKNLPELLILASLPTKLAVALLNHLSDMQRERGAALDEGMLDIDWSFPFKVRKASEQAKAEYTVQAGQYLHREDYEVLQIMICDKKGVYQDDPACQYGITLA